MEGGKDGKREGRGGGEKALGLKHLKHLTKPQDVRPDSQDVKHLEGHADVVGFFFKYHFAVSQKYS